MKSYKQFVSESYQARQNLNEFMGIPYLLSKGVKYGAKVARKVVSPKDMYYGARAAFGAGTAVDAYGKDDKVGTGLGAASVLKGPLGGAAFIAQVVRGLRKPAQAAPTPTVNVPSTPEKVGITTSKVK